MSSKALDQAYEDVLVVKSNFYETDDPNVASCEIKALPLHNHSTPDAVSDYRDFEGRFSSRFTVKENTKQKAEPKKNQTKRQLACEFEGCRWTFENQNKLDRHAKSHVTLGMYICQLCDAECVYEYNMYQHWRVTCKGFANRRADSDLKSLSVRELRSYVGTVLGMTNRIQEYYAFGGITFVPAEAFLEEKEYENDKEYFATCHMCSMAFHSKFMECHADVHRGRFRIDVPIYGCYVCHLCTRQFKDLKQLMKHWREDCHEVVAHTPLYPTPLEDEELTTLVYILLQQAVPVANCLSLGETHQSIVERSAEVVAKSHGLQGLLNKFTHCYAESWPLVVEGQVNIVRDSIPIFGPDVYRPESDNHPVHRANLLAMCSPDFYCDRRQWLFISPNESGGVAKVVLRYTKKKSMVNTYKYTNRIWPKCRDDMKEWDVEMVDISCDDCKQLFTSQGRYKLHQAMQSCCSNKNVSKKYVENCNFCGEKVSRANNYVHWQTSCEYLKDMFPNEKERADLKPEVLDGITIGKKTRAKVKHEIISDIKEYKANRKQEAEKIKNTIVNTFVCPHCGKAMESKRIRIHMVGAHSYEEEDIALKELINACLNLDPAVIMFEFKNFNENLRETRKFLDVEIYKNIYEKFKETSAVPISLEMMSHESTWSFEYEKLVTPRLNVVDGHTKYKIIDAPRPNSTETLYMKTAIDPREGLTVAEKVLGEHGRIWKDAPKVKLPVPPPQTPQSVSRKRKAETSTVVKMTKLRPVYNSSEAVENDATAVDWLTKLPIPPASTAVLKEQLETFFANTTPAFCKERGLTHNDMTQFLTKSEDMISKLEVTEEEKRDYEIALANLEKAKHVPYKGKEDDDLLTIQEGAEPTNSEYCYMPQRDLDKMVSMDLVKLSKLDINVPPQMPIPLDIKEENKANAFRRFATQLEPLMDKQTNGMMHHYTRDVTVYPLEEWIVAEAGSLSTQVGEYCGGVFLKKEFPVRAGRDAKFTWNGDNCELRIISVKDEKGDLLDPLAYSRNLVFHNGVVYKRSEREIQLTPEYPHGIIQLTQKMCKESTVGQTLKILKEHGLFDPKDWRGIEDDTEGYGLLKNPNFKLPDVAELLPLRPLVDSFDEDTDEDEMAKKQEEHDRLKKECEEMMLMEGITEEEMNALDSDEEEEDDEQREQSELRDYNRPSRTLQ